MTTFRMIAAGLALSLAACTSAPPSDGLARSFRDGQWVLEGHRHGDPVLHFDACEGCARMFRGAWREELAQLERDISQARAAKASAAPVSSNTPGGDQ